MIANMHDESPSDLATYGRFDQNIIYFARTLRGAGMRVGPAAIVDAVKAVETGGISSREDFYWTLHCVLVTRHEDHPVFDETFKLFWQSRGLLEKTLQMFSPTARHDNPVEERRAGQSRVAQSLFPDRQDKETEKPQFEIDAQLSASERELLMRKDFAQMTVEELAMTRR
ncbi:MAG: VWA domain-containing protein, partial [Pseudomonadota bacterium]